MNFDYETLRLLFWGILVLCILGFSICDGVVLGVCMLLPLLGKTDTERQTAINSIAPISLGSQAWLAAALALLFAAWPIAYAVFFSSLQAVLLLMLLVWLIRPLGLYFRNTVENLLWRQNWDIILGISGFSAAALLGIISGNLLKGIPFHLDSDMRIFFLGDFWGLLNPFALLLAALSVTLLLMYGAAFLQLNSSIGLYYFSKAWVLKAGVAFLILFALAGLWISRLEGYHISSDIFPGTASNPLSKFVKRGEGLWLDNYEHLPGLWTIPALAFISGGASIYLIKLDRSRPAFIASAITIAMTVLTAAVSMFPFLMPSNRSLNSSLTIWDAGASLNTLSALIWMIVIAFPLMVLLSRWAYSFMSSKTESASTNSPGSFDKSTKN